MGDRGHDRDPDHGARPARLTAGPGRVAAALFAGLVAVAAWSVYLLVDAPDNHRPDIQASIIAAAEAAGDGGRVDLAEVATFDWDRVHVYGSYTPPEFIVRDLGFDWYPGTRLDRLVDTTLQAQGFWLAVFVQGEDHVTGWLLGNLDRRHAWVDADSWAGNHARDDAWFAVTYLDGVSPGWRLSDLSGQGSH